MRISIPTLLTFNGGYVDTAGFLALQGLFTAHVTGNFVTIGASLVHGTTGVMTKLLALPVFCLMILAVRYFSNRLARLRIAVPNTLILIQVLLFVVAAMLALSLGPFENGDNLAAMVTGMTLVASMAVQNVLHRVYFAKSPPSTLMTGTTTQVMIDAADLLRGNMSESAHQAARERCATMAAAVLVFAAGCAVAALAYSRLGVHVFLLPPVVAAMAFLPRLQQEIKLGNQAS